MSKVIINVDVRIDGYGGNTTLPAGTYCDAATFTGWKPETLANVEYLTVTVSQHPHWSGVVRKELTRPVDKWESHLTPFIVEAWNFAKLDGC